VAGFACRLVLLWVEQGEQEEEPELFRTGVWVSPEQLPAFGSLAIWGGGCGGQSRLPYSDGEMGKSPVLIPPWAHLGSCLLIARGAPPASCWTSVLSFCGS